jgi:hypothetical protein
METATATTASEVSKAKEVTEKKPEEIKGDIPPAQNSVFGNLENAAKDAVEQIRYCDQQVALWQERKEKFQNSLDATLGRIKKEFGVSDSKTPTTSTKPRAKGGKGSTVPELIRNFLEANGAARSRDIRRFLLSKGKKTNPGVALRRMVKSGDLKNTSRGTYEIKK